MHQRILHELREAEETGRDRESAEDANRSRLRKRYAHLKTKNTFHLQWTDKKLGALTPFVILESKLEDHGIELDVLLKGTKIEDPHRITVSISGHAPAAETINSERENPLEQPLPTLQYDVRRVARQNDLPPVIYGLVGVLGGAMIGFFVMFLFYG